MTATLRSMRINHGGTTNAHGACTQFMVNHETSWCQRFHGFTTELHDWLRSLTNSREYSYGVCTNKHDSITIALRIRPHPITTMIRQECFKQFRTSIALPWSFPNHHNSSRFTTILLRITMVHDYFTNRGELQRHRSQKS